MKSLHFDGKSLRLMEKDIPEPGKDEAIIKVTYAGICNTDLEIFKGYMDFKGIPGHEFVGVVQEASDQNFIGKRVVGEINIYCGICSFCMRGEGYHCPHRSVLGIKDRDGTFSEYVLLPVRNLHVVPEQVPDLKAVFTEPLAAACRILEQIHIVPEYDLLVIGDGKLGQLIARVLKNHTDNVLVLGKHPRKMQMLEHLNIPTLHYRQTGQLKQSYPVVVEATGSIDGWQLAMQVVQPTGMVVLKSTYAGEHPVQLASLVINEVKVVGSRCGPFSKALYDLLKDRVDPRDLITEIVPFSDWDRAFEIAKNPESVKILLQFES